jgi:D-alanyl-D-alanine carboxypeptidase
LQEGDSLSLRDLLYTALMASDNVAATALAEFVGARLPNNQGLAPISNFVSHMNALTHTLGMKRTLFLNPSGSDNVEGTLPYSTASDMARLTRYAYSEADFPFFVSQKSRTIHVFRGVGMPVELRNTNELLDREELTSEDRRTGRARLFDSLL